MLNNMILRHDGLNTLWESNVNWVKCNDNGNREDIDEDEMNTFDDDCIISIMKSM